MTDLWLSGRQGGAPVEWPPEQAGQEWPDRSGRTGQDSRTAAAGQEQGGGRHRRMETHPASCRQPAASSSPAHLSTWFCRCRAECGVRWGSRPWRRPAAGPTAAAAAAAGGAPSPWLGGGLGGRDSFRAITGASPPDGREGTARRQGSAAGHRQRPVLLNAERHPVFRFCWNQRHAAYRSKR